MSLPLTDMGRKSGEDTVDVIVIVIVIIVMHTIIMIMIIVSYSSSTSIPISHPHSILITSQGGVNNVRYGVG